VDACSSDKGMCSNFDSIPADMLTKRQCFGTSAVDIDCCLSRNVPSKEPGNALCSGSVSLSDKERHLNSRIVAFEDYVLKREQLLQSRDDLLCKDMCRREMLLEKREFASDERGRLLWAEFAIKEVDILKRESALDDHQRDFELYRNFQLTQDAAVNFKIFYDSIKLK